jgi:hypothetical protein
MKKLATIFLFAAFFLAFSKPSYAITNPHNLSITQIHDFSGDCGRTIEMSNDHNLYIDEGLVVMAQVTVTGTINDSGGANNDYFAFILKDATGKTIMHSQRLVAVGSTATLTFGGNLQFSPVPNARPWTFSIYEGDASFPNPNYGDTHVALASLTFDPAEWIESCARVPSTSELAPETPPDDRLNWRFGDNGFVVYEGEEDSDILFHVYRVDGESNGHWLLSVTKTQAEDYKNNPPSTAIQLDRYENASVFALTTGEIQVNMYNLNDGKTYVLVFNAEGEITNSYVLEGFYLEL